MLTGTVNVKVELFVINHRIQKNLIEEASVAT
jgi:hypothetical protein